MENKKTADLYIRVSTDEQAEKGYSLRYQEEQLINYCKSKDIIVKNIYKEDYSAKTFNRPEFKKLLRSYNKASNRPNLLLFTKWDRFSREISSAYEVISKLKVFQVEPQGIEQALDLSVPENHLILAMYLAMPMAENLRRGLNVVGGMRRAKREGRFMGIAPKGYKNITNENGKKTIVPNEDAKIVIWAFEELAKGEVDASTMRNLCNKKGLKCSRSYFYHLIRNPTYCGDILIKAYGTEETVVVKGIHQPIISRELFEKVQIILNGKIKTSGYKICAKPELPLRGFLNCPRCGNKLTGSQSTGGSGIKHFYYHCKKGCPERVKAVSINDAFSDKLKDFCFKEEVEILYRKIIENLFGLNSTEQANSLQYIQSQITNYQSQLTSMLNMLSKNEISPSDFAAFKKEVEPKLSELENKNIEMGDVEVELKKYLKKGLSLIKNISQVYDYAPLDGKQKIIRSIFKNNLVFQNEGVRTDKLNEVFILIANVGKDFNGLKKKTEDDLNLQSCQVPYGFGLSNLIDDFQSLRNLMNSRNWKSVF